MRIYFAGLALLLTVPVVVIADDHVDIVKRAFSNISKDFHQEWAFTESVTEEGVTLVGRYDPRFSDNARWNLLTIDGRAPTADEIAEQVTAVLLERSMDAAKSAGVQQLVDEQTERLQDKAKEKLDEKLKDLLKKRK